MFAAMVLDSLDGRVARMTNTQSECGVQLSINDAINAHVGSVISSRGPFGICTTRAGP